MLRRIAIIATTTVMLAAIAATPAFGWGNGGDNGNGYGTHDWVLDQAIRSAGASASWIDVDIALKATDDPDYGPNADQELHGFKDIGYAQGGPQTAANEYFKLITAYNAGNYAEASRLLGTMSHYYSDVCQPYHTDVRGTDSVNPRHFQYEVAVAHMTNSRNTHLGWVNLWQRKPATDVRAMAVSAALYSRTKYEALDYSYAHSGLDSDKYAYQATGYVLNRAVNDLTDIIQAIPQGQGLSKPPARLVHRMQRMTYYYPRKGTATADMVRTQVVALDAAGKPMQGMAITFTWPLAIGLKSYTAYTDANGLAYGWQAPGFGIPLMQKRTVTARTVQSSVAATSSTWYMPTPVLAGSTTGMNTSLSNSRPRLGTVVTATTRVRTTSGKPVVGLAVRYTWCFKSGTIKTTVKTNSNGYARSSRNIGQAPRGYRVYVNSRTYAGRHTRNSNRSFVPQ